MGPFRAIAWDLDGTLADSEPIHSAALEVFAAGHKAPVDDLDENSFLGLHQGEVWRRLQDRFPPSLDLAGFREGITDAFVTLAREQGVPPMPGAEAVILRGRELGLPQACVSNSQRRTVDAILAALGFNKHLDFSLSVEDVPEGRAKPDPEPYLRAARRLRTDASETLAVEDSVAGITAARAAGMHAIAYRPHDDGAEAARTFAHAHRIIRSHDELLPLLAP